jgi:hypothetical protein
LIETIEPTAPSKSRTATNRANAAKSTGPITPEGKLKSSQNATKHGLLARSIVLEGEVLERFTALLDSLIDLFQPHTCVESALVENMAVARWRQMRLWGMEQADMAREMQKQALRAGNEETAAHDAPTRSAIAFRTLCDHSRSLDTFNRYETRFERQYLRSLDRLEKMRAKSDFAKRSHLGERGPAPSESGTF